MQIDRRTRLFAAWRGIVWPWSAENSKKPHQWQIEEQNQRERTRGLDWSREYAHLLCPNDRTGKQTTWLHCPCLGTLKFDVRTCVRVHACRIQRVTERCPRIRWDRSSRSSVCRKFVEDVASQSFFFFTSNSRLTRATKWIVRSLKHQSVGIFVDVFLRSASVLEIFVITVEDHCEINFKDHRAVTIFTMYLQ